MFTQVMQNPRFMALLQPPPPSQSIGTKKQKSEPAKAQPQVIDTDESMETPVHLSETMQSPNPVRNAQDQVAETPVFQAAPVQPATFQQPIAGSNGQGSNLQAMQQVFPPPSVHPGYFGGGSVFQSMAGHAPGNQFIHQEQCKLWYGWDCKSAAIYGISKFTTFTGFDDRKKALSFLEQFDKAYAGGNFTEASKVRKAATYLTGNAGQWWTSLLLQGQAPSTWIYFKRIFASAWLSDDFEADVMTEWHQLNAATCKNLDDFNRKFWKALLPVTSYSLPAEYCEFGPDFEKCKPWLIKNAPELYPDLVKEEADRAADQLGGLEILSGRAKIGGIFQFFNMLPPKRKVVSTKWIFKTKYKADGSLDKHKARLVARGFSQRPGVDFDETYAPTARMTTIRTVLCLAAHFGWAVFQMYVKSAFLNGEMEKEVYVSQPPGFQVTGKEDHVYRLWKALYGLKQAGRQWYLTLDQFLVKLGLRRTSSDANCYVVSDGSLVAIVIVYVDDLVFTGSTSDLKLDEEVKTLPGGKVKKKEKPEVLVEKVVRNKRKCVTIVKGLDMFGIKLTDASKKFGKKFASGASVVKGPTEKEQIDVQGDFMYDIVDFITETWKNVPGSSVYVLEDGKKVSAV
ncbi:hypothetical protein L7F22_002672 [Adiantum nelumboides]|nr:hypothetical protein [Adiantum nelumboides]